MKRRTVRQRLSFFWHKWFCKPCREEGREIYWFGEGRRACSEITAQDIVRMTGHSLGYALALGYPDAREKK
jgi:hypothetical protein